MKNMKHILALAFALVSLSVFGQKVDALWISGSAVPGGSVKLESLGDNTYKLATALKAGEVKLQTTEKLTADTRFLVPVEADASLVNYGIAWRLESDPKAAGWQVLFPEDHYRITVDVNTSTLKGELVAPWNELFIGGGATKNGWDNKHMQAFAQDSKNPYVWTWTGLLCRNDQYVEPTLYKIEGQLMWGPKQIHPLTQGEDILTSTRFRNGGEDTRWSVKRDGRYKITINLLQQTVKAEYLGE